MTYNVGNFPGGFPPITNSLGANVTLNNIATFFDGPSVAQGTVGTWFVFGSVTVVDSAGAAAMNAKLWDGTTLIASGKCTTAGAGAWSVITLSGVLANPAGNLRISVQDATLTTGLIGWTTTGLGKDSTITAFRIS